MTHRVFWAPDADESLQEIILTSEDRESTLRRVREIDFWLARNPLEFGESREDAVRIGVVTPLVVLFEVLDDPPTVIVMAIRRI